MFKTNPKPTGISSQLKLNTTGPWELRPGGMLVQKRNSDSTMNSVPNSTIKLKVKYASSIHQVQITPHSTFGELKKILAGLTGLHPQDQKLIYKDKERDSRAYLDVAGVKDGSKLVLNMSRERRVVESPKGLKEIIEISVEVDKLAKEVSNLEADICYGKRVMDKVLSSLIELLMTQLIKLDGIVADGDVKSQRRMQVKRVQNYIETLDMLKARNSKLVNNGTKAPLQKITNRHEYKNSNGSMPYVLTTKWETFNNANSKHKWEGLL